MTTSLQSVDWSKIPAPQDDGGADQLVGSAIPRTSLKSTDGGTVDLSSKQGLCVIYVYPMTGRPDVPLPDGWDMIPGARGCTPQSCAFRDHFADLRSLAVRNVFGVSTQKPEAQLEAARRLHLPFALLSDQDLEFGRALKLPTFDCAGMTLLKRLTLIVRNARIARVFYPVFPPDRSASEVIDWLRSRDAST